jgi:DNA polymerase
VKTHEQAGFQDNLTKSFLLSGSDQTIVYTGCNLFTTITELENALFLCCACPLNANGNRGPTSYNGNPDSPLMLVGEGPGGVEDEYGAPLVGPSGQLLDKALWSVGITRDKVYTTNVVKCRPKGNRTPTVEEGVFCASRWLDTEIDLVKPKVIVALGSVALKYLNRSDARITRDRGQWFTTRQGIPAIATYHPAYLLRLTGKDLVKGKWEVYYDLKAAVEKCLEFAPGYQLKSPQPPDLLQQFASRRDGRQLK